MFVPQYRAAASVQRPRGGPNLARNPRVDFAPETPEMNGSSPTGVHAFVVFVSFDKRWL
jgi:hypothetical protein